MVRPDILTRALFSSGNRGLAGHVSSAVLSPDGLQIAVAIDTSGTLTVWDVETGKVLHHNRRYRGFVGGLEFSGDGHRILLYSTDTIVRTYDAATGNPLGPPVRQTTAISGLSPVGVSPDGGKMVMHDQIPHALRVIDVDRGERLLTLPIDKEKVPWILWFNDKVSSVNFLSATGAFTVPLPRFDLPLEDARPLLQLLTGQQIDETDGIEFVGSVHLQEGPRDVSTRAPAMETSAGRSEVKRELMADPDDNAQLTERLQRRRPGRGRRAFHGLSGTAQEDGPLAAGSQAAGAARRLRRPSRGLPRYPEEGRRVS